MAMQQNDQGIFGDLFSSFLELPKNDLRYSLAEAFQNMRGLYPALVTINNGDDRPFIRVIDELVKGMVDSDDSQAYTSFTFGLVKLAGAMQGVVEAANFQVDRVLRDDFSPTYIESFTGLVSTMRYAIKAVEGVKKTYDGQPNVRMRREAFGDVCGRSIDAFVKALTDCQDQLWQQTRPPRRAPLPDAGKTAGLAAGD